MRVIAAIIVFAYSSIMVFALPKADILEVKWSKSQGTEIPQEFSLLDTNTALPLKNSYWLKISVQSDAESILVIEAGSNYMRNMSYYDAHGKFLFSGNCREIAFKKGINTFYIHYPFRDFKSTNNFEITLHDRLDYYQSRYLPNIIEAIFISIILFLFFLSLSFYVIGRFRDKLYLYYGWYLGSIAFFFSYQYGFLGSILPVINQVSPAYVWISSASLTIAYLYFAQSFLDLKWTDNKVYKLLNFGKYFVLSVIMIETITYFFGMDIQHSITYKSVVMVVQIVTMPYILYRCYLQKTTLSWIFISGAVILVMTTLVGQTVSTLRAVSDANLYIQLGLLIEVFIFSIGIGMRMVLINKEKRITQDQLIDQLSVNEKIQQDFIKQLEIKVSERTEELQKRNEEKETLLKEIHHRVKNNLQTISSLLNIQQRKLKDPAAISAIEDSKNRVQVMGLLHKFLYQHENFEEISIKPYLEQLMKMLVESHKTDVQVAAEVIVCDIQIDVDTSINIGLIINELIINSLKHAVSDDTVLRIILKIHVNENLLHIQLSDNGRADTIVLKNNNAGFGWKLVQSLVEKTEGNLSSQYKKGFVVHISIPLLGTKAYASAP